MGLLTIHIIPNSANKPIEKSIVLPAYIIVSIIVKDDTTTSFNRRAVSQHFNKHNFLFFGQPALFSFTNILLYHFLTSTFSYTATSNKCGGVYCVLTRPSSNNFSLLQQQFSKNIGFLRNVCSMYTLLLQISLQFYFVHLLITIDYFKNKYYLSILKMYLENLSKEALINVDQIGLDDPHEHKTQKLEFSKKSDLL